MASEWSPADWTEVGKVEGVLSSGGDLEVHVRRDGRVELDLDGEEIALSPAERDKLRELLDRAATTGQPPVMAPDWVELGSVPGAHGTLVAYRKPDGAVLLADGRSNHVVIPRLSLAGVAEILTRAGVPGQPATPGPFSRCPWWSDPSDDFYGQCIKDVVHVGDGASPREGEHENAHGIRWTGPRWDRAAAAPGQPAAEAPPTKEEIDRCGFSEDPYHRCRVCYDYAAGKHRPVTGASDGG